MFCDVSPAQVNPARRILNRKAFVDGASMTAAIAHIQHDTSGQTTSIQTQHTGGMEEELRHLEVFEKHLGCSDPVADGVVGRLCQKYWVFTRIDFELLEDLPPDGLHVVPVLDDAMVHWVAQL